MRYTKYFGQVNKDNGLQRLSNFQLGRIMNIAYLEGRKRGVQEAIVQLEKPGDRRNITLLDFHIAKRITALTGNKAPKSLMEEICYLSEKEV